MSPRMPGCSGVVELATFSAEEEAGTFVFAVVAMVDGGR